MSVSASPPLPANPPPTARPWRLRLRHYLEWMGLSLTLGFFRLFSIDRASAIGGWIGRHLAAPFSRRARANLALAYPEKSDAERNHILLGVWDNLGRVLAEYGHLDEIHAVGDDPRITLEGTEHLAAAQAGGKGILLLSGHFANWEILQFSLHDYGIQGAPIVRPANNPLVHRWLDRLRSRNGMPEQIPKGASGMRRGFTLLRKGEALLLLIDQRTSEGVLVPFFGRDAFTTPAPAALALRLNAVIVPISLRRVGGARFVLRAHPPILPEGTGDMDRDVWALTAELTQFIEARVRERPEQWLWTHKRWTKEGAPLRHRAQARSSERGDAPSATSKRV
jgi:KDO2-lipid IV(A) lauroyltransferase